MKDSTVPPIARDWFGMTVIKRFEPLVAAVKHTQPNGFNHKQEREPTRPPLPIFMVVIVSESSQMPYILSGYLITSLHDSANPPHHFLHYLFGMYRITFNLAMRRLSDDPQNGWGTQSLCKLDSVSFLAKDNWSKFSWCLWQIWQTSYYDGTHRLCSRFYLSRPQSHCQLVLVSDAPQLLYPAAIWDYPKLFWCN